MEYTQEQIDTMLAEAKKGLLTEEELTRRVTSEVDRRVETGIQKGIDTNKTKWEEEFLRKQTMTAEEIAAKTVKDAQDILSAKEKEINRKANLTDARELLATAGVPKAQYDKVVNILISEDSEATKVNVQNFIDTFSAMKTEIETQIKSDISKIPPPNQNINKPTTKTDFDKLGFADKVAFKQTHPDLYKEFIK